MVHTADGSESYTLQQYMVVPPTPLHTSRVLTEDKELWDDVKVGRCSAHFMFRKWPQGVSKAADLRP